MTRAPVVQPGDDPSPSPARALFVYWRIAAQDLAPVLAAVRAAQAQLAADWPGLQVRLWQRSDPGVPATVMETYAAPGGISPAAQARIDAVLGACVPCPRHVESFQPADNVSPD